MKKLTAVFLLAIIVLSLLPISAFALEGGNTYYVSSSGSDENSGTSEEAPWKTLAKLSAQTFSAGDKILFKNGDVFEGKFIAHGNGTEENPVIVSSYGDENQENPILRTSAEDRVFIIENVDFWTVENLNFTSPNGGGIMINACHGKAMRNITVRNCSFYDVYYKDVPEGNFSFAPIFISSSGKGSLIENLTLSDLDMTRCGYGIHMNGNTIEFSPDIFVSPEKSYHRNILFENVTMTEIFYDGMAICSSYNMTIRNCLLLRTSLLENWYTAPLWMHHAKYVTVENCEIAGSENSKDGMAIDFDGWTSDSTYQYVYSHDNVRFMQNCVYDNTTKNQNCTVRYCLSVNDNELENNVGMLRSGTTAWEGGWPEEDLPTGMYNFKFYNNTIINASNFRFWTLRDSLIQNNIFAFSPGRYIYLSSYVGKDDHSGDNEYNINGYHKSEFTGIMSNNCFYQTSVNKESEDSIYANPMFAGDDFTDINSFVLSSDSPCIGAGVKVEDDMGEQDFFGNKITSETVHNIGCYEGNGVENGEQYIVFQRLIDAVVSVFARLIGALTGVYRVVKTYF